MNRIAVLAALFTCGCDLPLADPPQACTLDVALSGAQGVPGDQIAVVGGPLTTRADTIIVVGSVPARVVSIDRTEACDTCDVCRDEADCGPCGTCTGDGLRAERRAACFGEPFALPATFGACGSCEEQLVFEVPEIAPQSTTVQIINGAGASAAIEFEVVQTGPTSADSMRGSDSEA